MYSEADRKYALDLWFERLGQISLRDFVEELGWPSRSTMSKWIRADPRHDPDKATYKSRPVLTKLEAIRRVSEGASCAQAGREVGMSGQAVRDAVDRYARGGTAELLPKPRPRKGGGKGAAMAGGEGKAEGKAAAGGGAEGWRLPCELPPDVPDELPDDPEELKAIIADLRLRNDALEAVVDVLKGGRGRADGGPLTTAEKADAVSRLAPAHGVSAACRAVGLARSTYYHHLRAEGRPRKKDLVAGLVEEIFLVDGRSARGYRFVKAKLDGRLGRPTSEKVVRAAMRDLGLEVCYAGRGGRRYSSYAGEADEAPANLLLREDGTHDFRPAGPWQVLASDVTEFKVGGRKVYLSPVIDLYDLRPLGWSCSTRPDADLADSSLRKALASMPAGARPVVHTDRGCHYRWPGWKAICEEAGAVRSMSRKGCSPDNAACEGFFGCLKNEFYYGRDWSGWTVEEFEAALDAWMRDYCSERLKGFEEGGRTVYDTIDGRRERLGWGVPQTV